jgi:predicted ATPase
MNRINRLRITLKGPFRLVNPVHPANPVHPVQFSLYQCHVFQFSNAQAEAEGYYHQAIAIAQQQNAKAWELRAATSLARLWHQQGKIAEARQMLAEIYGWFTVGFDTADLKDAQALLDELQ